MDIQEPKSTYRILHFLSPVKWRGKVFLNNHDSNWKVCEKTIDFLPKCHHFVLVPPNHTIKPRKNVTFLEYDYPRSVQLNRSVFDYRNINLDFTKCDIDFVFSHEPCQTYAIQNWFHTNRYYEDVKYFSFFHWIDCKKGRGTSTGSPPFFWRQQEAMEISTKNFVHSEVSLDYFDDNFKKRKFKPDIPKDKFCYMPLSGSGNIVVNEKSASKYENVLVFNHRYNKLSGVKMFESFLPYIPKNFKIWITDEKCKLKGDNIIVKTCSSQEYDELMSNCYASLCFIDSYSTWNLSIQDSLIRGKPLLAFDHPMIKKVIGDDYPFLFKDVETFLSLLIKLPKNYEKYIDRLKMHDTKFKNNLIRAMNACWCDNQRGTPKDSPKWQEQILEGNDTKKGIASVVKPKLRLNSSNHYIRRNLLHHGFKDDYESTETRYIPL